MCLHYSFKILYLQLCLSMKNIVLYYYVIMGSVFKNLSFVSTFILSYLHSLADPKTVLN